MKMGYYLPPLALSPAPSPAPTPTPAPAPAAADASISMSTFGFSTSTLTSAPASAPRPARRLLRRSRPDRRNELRRLKLSRLFFLTGSPAGTSAVADASTEKLAEALFPMLLGRVVQTYSMYS